MDHVAVKLKLPREAGVRALLAVHEQHARTPARKLLVGMVCQTCFHPAPRKGRAQSRAELAADLRGARRVTSALIFCQRRPIPTSGAMWASVGKTAKICPIRLSIRHIYPKKAPQMRGFSPVGDTGLELSLGPQLR
jgi:hypothetical protein